jgi:hypothetical protein
VIAVVNQSLPQAPKVKSIPQGRKKRADKLKLLVDKFDLPRQAMYDEEIKVTPCQGVPSLSRKAIVKNITQSDASKIAFPYRVALDSAFPVERVAGRSVF